MFTSISYPVTECRCRPVRRLAHRPDCAARGRKRRCWEGEGRPLWSQVRPLSPSRGPAGLSGTRNPSMGGLLAADALAEFVNTRPDKHAPLWPNIVACIAYDTPVRNAPRVLSVICNSSSTHICSTSVFTRTSSRTARVRLQTISNRHPTSSTASRLGVRGLPQGPLRPPLPLLPLPPIPHPPYLRKLP